MGIQRSLTDVEADCRKGRQIIILDVKNAFNSVPFEIIISRLNDIKTPSNIQ